jgi:hypothetical protein
MNMPTTIATKPAQWRTVTRGVMSAPTSHLVGEGFRV